MSKEKKQAVRAARRATHTMNERTNLWRGYSLIGLLSLMLLTFAELSRAGLPIAH